MRPYFLAVAVLGLLSVSIVSSQAAVTLVPPYDSSYSITGLGSVPGLPTNYGGLVLEAGDPNTLLIGGGANGANGAIYSIGVTRGAGNHITGFTGTASLYASAPYIDGGLSYGPGGVLFYTAYPTNEIGEIKPGSVSPDKVVSLTGLVTSSVGSLQFAPDGSFKIASYNGGGFYSASLSPDGSGTYNISSVTLQSTPGNGPEGIVYVPTGSPLFGTPSLLLAEYSTGTVGAYQVDSSYNLIGGTRQSFISGLSGAEGAFIDPLTGDFLFSTFGGGDQVIEVQGFVQPPSATPEPSTLLVCATAGLIASAYASHRRRGRTR